MQKGKAGHRALGVLIERNKAKAQKLGARLRVWGVLEEQSPVMSPPSQMYEEACGILKRSESLEKIKVPGDGGPPSDASEFDAVET